jgi:hypothetical protein
METNDKIIGLARLAGPVLEIAQVALSNLVRYKTEIEKITLNEPNDAELGRKIRAYIKTKQYEKD